MNTCACTWHWNFSATPRRPEDHMAGICPLYAPPAPAERLRPRCNCSLIDLGDKVLPELHEEDCALYLRALAGEQLDADEAIVRAHERRNG